MLALFSLTYHHTHIRYCVIAQYGIKKLTQKMRPFRAKFFVFKLFTYHIALEPVPYMCVPAKLIKPKIAVSRNRYLQAVFMILGCFDVFS